jgi:LacI family transcriptional regulator
MPKLTINEIARLAQVSKGTVSKVLNNYPGINEKTRERVLMLVKQHEFEPNSSAQALALKRTGNIGLLIPHSPEYAMRNDFWASLVMTVTAEVIKNSLNLVLHLPQQEGKLDDLFRSILRKKQLDGMIIGAELLDKNFLATLIYNEMPFVMLGQNPDFAHYAVDVDNHDAGRRITDHLLSHGYRRIAMVTGPAEYYHYEDRNQGYTEALDKAGVDWRRIVNVPQDDRPAMRAAVAGLMAGDRPDAIISGSGGDFMFDCLIACQEHGFQIPANGFATFDDYRHLDFMKPGITAVRQPFLEMGRSTVGILLELIRGQKPGSELIIEPTTIIPRASCGEKPEEFHAFV